MRFSNPTYYHWGTLFLLMLFILNVKAQTVAEGNSMPKALSHREAKALVTSDTVVMDTLFENRALSATKIDSIRQESNYMETVAVESDTSTIRFSYAPDSVKSYSGPHKRERFIPNPKKSLWLAMVIPGGGQIYNRKYWKLPLVYGGFLGCAYAMTWNNTMYRDYSQAYIDIMDSDENTKSYENFLPMNYDVQSNLTRLQELFKRKKNYYRRYRDLSMFCMIGVYVLSIIDAYVDAELSSFDISNDLSLKVHPTIINGRSSAMRAYGLNTNSYGLQCDILF